MAKIEFKIIGMDCAEEVASLKKELAPVSGIQDLAFDIFNAKMIVSYEQSQVTPEELQDAVKRTGMTAEPWKDSANSPNQEAMPSGNRRALLTVASGVLVGGGLLCHILLEGLHVALSTEGAAVPILVRSLYSAGAVAGAWLVLPKAWLALRRLRPDMNLLMIVAVGGAIAIGQWFEAGTVAFLFALSIVLEAWSVGRARKAVMALMALTPPRALVKHEGAHSSGHAPETDDKSKSPQTSHESDTHEHLLDVADVPVGSIIIVKPGEKFPLDGRVLRGETSVNQAPITGESVPVSKSPGDEVFAGTINGDGTVEFVSNKPANDTTVAHIIKMVGEAQSRRSPSEQWVETFARYYTPVVMILAIAVVLLPPLLLGGAWLKWIYEGLVLLVIACPCALVISTPVSIVASLTAAAKNGVLIKGGMFAEVPAHIRAIALDKTGTVTEGRPSVKQIVPLSGHNEQELIEIAAAIESQSEHPLARAVMAHAAKMGTHPQRAEQYQAIKGKGASAKLNGADVWIGSHRYLEERNQETPEMHQKLEALSAGGASVIVIGNNEHVCGFIAVEDRVRDKAKNTVAALRLAGIEHIVMLTGDNSGTANAVARAIGVDEVKAELLPEDKVKAIEDLVQRYGQVAMVGDGVNDAPAMARSSLGIAMGAAGTDAAIETADIALMSDDLSKLEWLIGHSRHTLRIIRQNIFASLIVKALFVVLTLLGSASLWGAIAADTGMSLLVVFNALRLLRG